MEHSPVRAWIGLTLGKARLAWRSGPFALAAAALAVLTFVSVIEHYQRPAPQDPWDAALFLDGVRASRGLPVYEGGDTGHAATMYGTLVPYAIGAGIRVFGPDFRVARSFNLIGALLAIAVLVAAFVRGSLPMAFAAALAFAVGERVDQYFTVVRPDAAAFGLAAAALALWYRRRPFLSALCFALAFGFKQNAAIFALVPLFDRQPGRWLPIAAVALSVLGIAIWNSTALSYLLLPFRYPIRTGLFFEYGVGLWVSFPVGLLAVGARVFRRKRWLGLDRVGAQVLCLAWFNSALALAKDGGAPNSALPFLLVLAVLAVRWGAPFARLAIRRRPLAALPLAVLAFVSCLGLRPHVAWGQFVPGRGSTWAIVEWWGRQTGPRPEDRRYDALVTALAKLPGVVESPEDTTLAFRARGHLGRSVVAEWDARPQQEVWGARVPDTVAKDLARADVLVAGLRWISKEDIHRAGFSRADRTWAPYVVWFKEGPR